MLAARCAHFRAGCRRLRPTLQSGAEAFFGFGRRCFALVGVPKLGVMLAPTLLVGFRLWLALVRGRNLGAYLGRHLNGPAVATIRDVHHLPSKGAIPANILAFPVLPLIEGNFLDYFKHRLKPEREERPPPVCLVRALELDGIAMLVEARGRVISLTDVAVQVIRARIA